MGLVSLRSTDSASLGFLCRRPQSPKCQTIVETNSASLSSASDLLYGRLGGLWRRDRGKASSSLCQKQWTNQCHRTLQLYVKTTSIATGARQLITFKEPDESHWGNQVFYLPL